MKGPIQTLWLPQKKQRPSYPTRYVLWIFILSSPFYLVGELGPGVLPVELPISALMVVCPALAIWVHQSHSRLKELSQDSFKLKLAHIKGYMMAILIMPCVMILKYFVMDYSITQLSLPPISTIDLSVIDIGSLALLFFAGSVAEEIGWTGYLTNSLLRKHGVLATGLIIGFVWAIWHIIPYVQMGKDVDWIIWQCIASIPKRIVMVWLFLKFDRSVFVTILFHTFINLSVFVFPIMGSYYDPFYFNLVFVGFIGIGYLVIQSPSLLQKANP